MNKTNYISILHALLLVISTIFVSQNILAEAAEGATSVSVDQERQATAEEMGYFFGYSFGNMFQSNQAFQQFIFITGGDASFFVDKGWLFGSLLALIVGLVIIGGIKSIARVTTKLVPFMTLAYVAGAVLVIGLNAEKIPWALSAIFSEAFNPSAMTGGMLGVMILVRVCVRTCACMCP